MYRERDLRNRWFLPRKEELGINVGVDGQTWLGLMALIQMGATSLYRERKKQIANLSSGKTWLK